MPLVIWETFQKHKKVTVVCKQDNIRDFLKIVLESSEIIFFILLLSKTNFRQEESLVPFKINFRTAGAKEKVVCCVILTAAVPACSAPDPEQTQHAVAPLGSNLPHKAPGLGYI